MEFRLVLFPSLTTSPSPRRWLENPIKAVRGKSEPSALSLNGRSFHRRRNDCGDALRHPRTLRVGERPRGRRGRFGRRKTRSDAGAEGARVLAEATARGGMWVQIGSATV